MTSSVEDSHANPSASQESDSPKRTNAGCGPSSHDAFAYYDPDSHCWRTCQGSFLPDLETYSETWPRSGMMRNGTAYRRPPLVPRTYVTEFSLWATPTVNDAKSRGTSSLGRSLAREVGGYPNPEFCEWLMGFPPNWTEVAREMYPTPRAQSGVSRKPGTGGRCLQEEARKKDAVSSGQLNPMWVEWLQGFPPNWTEVE